MKSAHIIVRAFLSFTVMAGSIAQASITHLSDAVVPVPSRAGPEITLGYADGGMTAVFVTSQDSRWRDLSDPGDEAAFLARPPDYPVNDITPVPELSTFALMAFALSVGAALLKARRKAGNY